MTNRILEGGSTTRILEGGSTIRTLEGSGTAFERAAAQTITESDSVVKIYSAIRTASQTITLSDVVSRGASTFNRAVSNAAITISQIVVVLKIAPFTVLGAKAIGFAKDVIASGFNKGVNAIIHKREPNAE